MPFASSVFKRIDGGGCERFTNKSRIGGRFDTHANGKPNPAGLAQFDNASHKEQASIESLYFQRLFGPLWRYHRIVDIG